MKSRLTIYLLFYVPLATGRKLLQLLRNLFSKKSIWKEQQQTIGCSVLFGIIDEILWDENKTRAYGAFILM